MKKTPSIQNPNAASLRQMVALPVILLALGSAVATAQTTWTGGSGDWADAGNWSGAAPSGTTDDAVFAGNSSQETITFSANAPVKTLQFTGAGDYVFQSTASGVVTIGRSGNAGGPLQLGASGGSNVSLTLESNVKLSVYTASSYIGNADAGGVGENNTLTVTGTGAQFYSLGFATVGNVATASGSTLTSDNNRVIVSNGGVFNSVGLYVGAYNSANNTFIVTGSGSQLIETNATSGKLVIGAYKGSDTSSSVKILDGATATVGASVNVERGTLVVDKGSSITANGTNGGVVIGNGGTLIGAGTVIADVSYSNANTQDLAAVNPSVKVGTEAGGFGVLNVTGNYDNTSLTTTLKLGDLASGTVAGVNFDQLSVTGAFTLGGTLALDVSNLLLPATATELQLVSWGSATGASDSIVVSFIGNSGATPIAPDQIDIRSDGIYLTGLVSAIPEPATWAALAGLMALAAAALRRRMRA